MNEPDKNKADLAAAHAELADGINPPIAKIPGIGMRNVKTAVSATLCAIIYMFFDRNPTFACIGAVFGMDNSVPSSIKTGGNRLIGTVIGGLTGMLFFSISLIMPYRKLMHLVLLFVGIMVLIYLSHILKCSGAIGAGAVVFFIVMLNTPENQYVSYALNRMFDTGFGVIMSILINWIHIKLPRHTGEITFKK
ncbi:MAG: aromatic acid exporter family protein [Oscillospiraceae bacterium]